MGLVALAHTLPPSTLNEVRMESQMFVFRVNMDLQVTYCENRYSYSDTQRHNNTTTHRDRCLHGVHIWWYCEDVCGCIRFS